MILRPRLSHYLAERRIKRKDLNATASGGERLTRNTYIIPDVPRRAGRGRQTEDKIQGCTFRPSALTCGSRYAHCRSPHNSEDGIPWIATRIRGRTLKKRPLTAFPCLLQTDTLAGTCAGSIDHASIKLKLFRIGQPYIVIFKYSIICIGIIKRNERFAATFKTIGSKITCLG